MRTVLACIKINILCMNGFIYTKTFEGGVNSNESKGDDGLSGMQAEKLFDCKE